MTESIRVLITDDHSIVREGLTLILETTDDIEVVGEAADGAEALRLVAEHQPDVVLMDLRMPGMDGLTAIEHLQRDYPQPDVRTGRVRAKQRRLLIVLLCIVVFTDVYEAVPVFHQDLVMLN